VLLPKKFAFSTIICRC